MKDSIMCNKVKHALHCSALITMIIWTTILTLVTQKNIWPDDEINTFNPWEKYGFIGCGILYIFRILVFLALPQVLLHFLGLISFNAFPGKVSLKGSPLLTPLICVRIVTRGDFPQLVRENVVRNIIRCTEAGMDNFLIEVVTDKPIGVTDHRRIREIIVPSSYKPKNGALYKARALQYCLEDDVNILADTDYIVHLDEETLISSDAARGIINFVLEGKYHFGQGLITYANDRIVNWITTLADSMRVADDMGKLRAQFYFFHKPILSWKGSYIVAKVGAEKHVSFDHGIRGSLAEDCHFAMLAYKYGYTFNFIDGEMWEKSTFCISDFIKQRKRWLQGIYLVVHSPKIPWRYKIWLFCSLYAWITMPLTLSNIILGLMFPLQVPFWLNFLISFIGSVNIYMYMFGIVKSFSIRRIGILKYTLCLSSVLFIIVISASLESIAIIYSIFDRKKKFYVVQKDYNTINI